MKLFRIKLEDESFVRAENEQKAIEEFWNRKKAGDFDLDTFIEDATIVEEIEEVEGHSFDD